MGSTDLVNHRKQSELQGEQSPYYSITYVSLFLLIPVVLI